MPTITERLHAEARRQHRAAVAAGLIVDRRIDPPTPIPLPTLEQHVAEAETYSAPMAEVIPLRGAR